MLDPTPTGSDPPHLHWGLYHAGRDLRRIVWTAVSHFVLTYLAASASPSSAPVVVHGTDGPRGGVGVYARSRRSAVRSAMGAGVSIHAATEGLRTSAAYQELCVLVRLDNREGFWARLLTNSDIAVHNRRAARSRASPAMQYRIPTPPSASRFRPHAVDRRS